MGGPTKVTQNGTTTGFFSPPPSFCSGRLAFCLDECAVVACPRGCCIRISVHTIQPLSTFSRVWLKKSNRSPYTQYRQHRPSRRHGVHAVDILRLPPWQQQKTSVYVSRSLVPVNILALFTFFGREALLPSSSSTPFIDTGQCQSQPCCSCVSRSAKPASVSSRWQCQKPSVDIRGIFFDEKMNHKFPTFDQANAVFISVHGRLTDKGIPLVYTSSLVVHTPRANHRNTLMMTK